MRRLTASETAHRVAWHRFGAVAVTCGLVAATGIAPGCTPDFPTSGMVPGQVIIQDPVGNDCDTATIAVATLPVFEGSGLTTAYGCAGCHNGGTPNGVGAAWGPDSDLTAAGWHAAVLQLAANVPVTSVAEHTLYTHFNGSDVTHPVNSAALTDMETWLNSFLDNGGDACGGGPPIACDLNALLGDTSADYVASGLTTAYSCAACHNTGTPDGRGQAWGPNNDLSDTGWQLAVATLALADVPGLSDISSHTLYTHFDGSDAIHPVSEAGKSGVNAYLTSFLDAGGLDCVGAVGDGDGDGDGDPIVDDDGDGIDDLIDNCLGLYNPAQTDSNNSGVGDDCDPLCMGNTFALPDEPQSRAKFADLNLPAYFTCASCHDSGTVDGTGQGWGPGAGDYYDAVIGHLTREEDLDTPGEDTDIARYWDDPAPTVHTANAAARQALITFLDYRRTEQAIPLEECLAPGDGDGDGDGCDPLPIDETTSLAYWNELDVTFHFSSGSNCAQCHGESDPNAGGIGWGSPSANPNAEEWHYASYTKFGNPPVGTVEEIPAVSLVTHFGPALPNDSFHPQNQAADDDVSDWLEYLVTGCKP
jgi:hypothetical protein